MRSVFKHSNPNYAVAEKPNTALFSPHNVGCSVTVAASILIIALPVVDSFVAIRGKNTSRR